MNQMNLLLILGAIAVIYYVFFYDNKEKFENREKVIIKAGNNYVKTCNEDALCLTNNDNEASTFEIFEHTPQLLSFKNLENNNYITSCQEGEGMLPCNGKVRLFSRHPFIDEAKMLLVKNGEQTIIKLHDGKYLGVMLDGHLAHVDENNAINVEIRKA